MELTIKPGDIIITSIVIDESEEHKTYSSTKYKVKDIRITSGLPNIIVEETWSKLDV